MEKDILGQAVDEAALIFSGARKDIKDMLPLGPRNVRMTKRELQRQVEKNPGMMERMAQGSPGAQQALQQLLTSDLNSGSIEEYLAEEQS